eukprot:m.669359 g.669359  ORF g.669359 m.669359 type:complete len:366 (-) comp22762_c1_seq8:96-1193(-)
MHCVKTVGHLSRSYPYRSFRRSLTRCVAQKGASTWPWDAPWDYQDPAVTRRLKTTDDYVNLRANWAENVALGHAEIRYPTSIHELQDIVRSANGKIRAVGSAHSFTDAMDTPGGTLISTSCFTQVHGLDPDAMTVKVESGITYGQLAKWLHPMECALNNVASLPHISVGGGIATGSHGTGVGFGNLASDVAAIEYVTASGDIVRYSRDETPDLLQASVVALGCLGIATTIELDIYPTYKAREMVYSHCDFDAFVDGIADLSYTRDAVSAFVDFEHEDISLLFMRDRMHNNDYDITVPMDCSALPQTFMGGDLYTKPIVCYESGESTASTHHGTWFDTQMFFMNNGWYVQCSMCLSCSCVYLNVSH